MTHPGRRVVLGSPAASQCSRRWSLHSGSQTTAQPRVNIRGCSYGLLTVLPGGRVLPARYATGLPSNGSTNLGAIVR